jgi:hypothetical protein
MAIDTDVNMFRSSSTRAIFAAIKYVHPVIILKDQLQDDLVEAPRLHKYTCGDARRSYNGYRCHLSHIETVGLTGQSGNLTDSVGYDKRLCKAAESGNHPFLIQA